MWEYKVECIVLLHPDGHTGDVRKLLPREEQERYGDYWWQKTLALELEKFGRQGWEAVSIDQELLSGKVADGFVLFKRLKRL